MRKTLILFLLLLILGTGITCYGHYAVNADKDTVTLTEQVIYGNKAAAEGITIQLHTHYNNQLFWDTTYSIGKRPDIVTDFTFSYIPEAEKYSYTYHGVELNRNTEFSMHLDTDHPTGIDKAYHELWDAATPGMENRKIIYLKDYLDYYPLSKNLDFPNLSIYLEEFEPDYNQNYLSPLQRSYVKLFYDFFKIPVLEDETYEISISVDTNGNIQHAGGNSTNSDSFHLYTMNTMTDDACFFTFDTHTSQGNIIDTSRIPGGYGIYRLLRPTNTDNNSMVSPEDLAMVYPLDPKTKLMNLTTAPDKSKLLLFTTYKQHYCMTVIDAATMETLQEIEIASFEGDEAIWNTYIQEDFLVIELSDGRLALLTTTEAGDYQLEFVAANNTEELPVYDMSLYPSMDWNGERLAVSGIMSKNAVYESCSFYLAVYDKTGLLYWGEYENSLATGYSDNDSYSYHCHPINDNPLVISW